MEAIKAVVQKIVSSGKHGPFFVTKSDQIDGSVTCSLEPTVWAEDEWPEEGEVVYLSRLRQKRAGWRAKAGRFWKLSDEQQQQTENKERSSEMKNVTTLVTSYNDIDGYKQGSYGNGRVVIQKTDREKWAKGENTEAADLGVLFETGFASIFGDVEIDNAYVYLGEFNSLEDPRFKAFQASLSAVMKLIKDKSRIHIVGCHCGMDRKRHFCQHEGFDFIQSECGGDATLGRIVRDILKDVPKDEEASLTPKLVEEFALSKDASDGWSTPTVTTFASLDGILLAGCSNGLVLWNRDGWKMSPLKLKQGVNVITADGDSVLVGDGSCCSGATFRLKLDGKFELIRPIDGQRDGEDNLNGNVYAFARRGDELLAGGGGCSGQHIYRLNKDGRWQYHPKDPGLYVTAMLTAKDGDVYIAMGSGCWSNESVYRYNGKGFQNLGHIPGGVREIFEHKGKIYVASTDSGCIQPTNFSNGYIHVVNGEMVERVWSGVGGVRGFFLVKGKLHASGVNQSTWTTIILRQTGKEWHVVARFDQPLEITSHGDTVYAGGSKKIGKDKKAPAIYTVTGL